MSIEVELNKIVSERLPVFKEMTLVKASSSYRDDSTYPFFVVREGEFYVVYELDYTYYPKEQIFKKKIATIYNDGANNWYMEIKSKSVEIDSFEKMVNKIKKSADSSSTHKGFVKLVNLTNGKVVYKYFTYEALLTPKTTVAKSPPRSSSSSSRLSPKSSKSPPRSASSSSRLSPKSSKSPSSSSRLSPKSSKSPTRKLNLDTEITRGHFMTFDGKVVVSLTFLDQNGEEHTFETGANQNEDWFMSLNTFLKKRISEL
jgi:hypothetical protein